MFSSFYFGVVTDNKDPEGLHRIKVSITEEEQAISEWIPVLSPYTGSNYGFYALPEIDDQVLVASLDNSNIKKIAIGFLWSETSNPPTTDENPDADLNQDGKNNLHFIKTKSENKLIFDDTEGAEKIQLITPENKARFEFSTGDELISLITEHDVTLNAKGSVIINAEEIEINSKKQLNMNCEELQIASKKEFNISSDKDISIKGTGIALN